MFNLGKRFKEVFSLFKPKRTPCSTFPVKSICNAPTASSQALRLPLEDSKFRFFCNPRQNSSLETGQQMQIAWQRLELFVNIPLHKASLSFFLASWQFLCQVLAHTSIMNSLHCQATEKHSWEVSRSQQKRNMPNCKDLVDANTCTALVSIEAKLIFRPSCIYYLIKHEKKNPDSINLHYAVLAVISPVYYIVPCSTYSGHTEKSGQRNSIKRLKLNLLLCLHYFPCFILQLEQTKHMQSSIRMLEVYVIASTLLFSFFEAAE